jgi:hypothetical protein
MAAQYSAALNLAHAFLSGAWSVPAMAERGAQASGMETRWLRGLARRVVARFGTEAPVANPDALADFIRSDDGFRRVWGEHLRGRTFPVRRVYRVASIMVPAAGAPSGWSVPSLTTTAAVADWLGLQPSYLDWFADCQRRLRLAESGALQHYTYRWLVSRRGRARLLEIPKARLKEIQRRILHEILDHIPPHDAAHGFRTGRSILTYVAPHVGRPIVLHFDLRQFFPSIRTARVAAVFRTAGYPPPVARALAALCTNAVPDDVLRSRPIRARPAQLDAERAYRERHLPQGSPTSPALANLCAYRLDCRLAGLSRAVGAKYTRYADDLVFSGGEVLERSVRRFHVHVCRIALEEGFEINTRKSHFMRQSVRQQVAGVVLNARPNVGREEYDRLKAIVTNCIRHGPASQNRDGHADLRAHLAGRIAYLAMINPAKGERLRALFRRIAWHEATT